MRLCPNCKTTAVLKGDGFYICNRCGAEEMDNPIGNIWRLTNGRVVAAPAAEAKQLEKAKEEWPSGNWN